MIQRKIKKLRNLIGGLMWFPKIGGTQIFMQDYSQRFHNCSLVRKRGNNWIHIPPTHGFYCCRLNTKTTQSMQKCYMWISSIWCFSGRACEDFLNSPYSQAKHTPNFKRNNVDSLTLDVRYKILIFLIFDIVWYLDHF